MLFYKQNIEEYNEVLKGYDQRASQILVAFTKTATETKIVGLLRMIITPIGPEDDLPIIKQGGKELLQAKIMDFFVLPDYRRQKIGRQLQERAILEAKKQSCYQICSFSYHPNEANHALKLSMGFAVRPEFRKNKTAYGLYFIMPLKTDYL